ncbi:MAG TPA: hypothetical protein VIK86_06415 [Candidatus Paceibacterota bacterium]
MKTNIRKLSLILKVFNEDDFYVITVYEHEIILQGYFKQAILAKLKKLKFKITVSNEGWIDAKRGNIGIVLS